MGFKLPEDYTKRKEEIHNLKFIDFDGKEVHISDLQDQSVTPEMRQKMRMNSYTHDDLPPKLTDEALIIEARNYLNQCGRKQTPCSTYNDAVVHVIMPELLKRLEERVSNQ